MWTTHRPLWKGILQEVLHMVPSSVSSFKLQDLLFSSRTNSCLRLLPRLPVLSVFTCIFHSIKCLRMQFVREMWPIQLAFLSHTVCRIFHSALTLCNTSSFFHTIQSVSRNYEYIYDPYTIHGLVLRQNYNFINKLKNWRWRLNNLKYQ